MYSKPSDAHFTCVPGPHPLCSAVDSETFLLVPTSQWLTAHRSVTHCGVHKIHCPNLKFLCPIHSWSIPPPSAPYSSLCDVTLSLTRVVIGPWELWIFSPLASEFVMGVVERTGIQGSNLKIQKIGCHGKHGPSSFWANPGKKNWGDSIIIKVIIT